jgi:hypothetical protein
LYKLLIEVFLLIFRLKSFIRKFIRLLFLVSVCRNVIVLKQGQCAFTIFLLHILFVLVHRYSNNKWTERIGDVAERHREKKGLWFRRCIFRFFFWYKKLPSDNFNNLQVFLLISLKWSRSFENWRDYHS